MKTLYVEIEFDDDEKNAVARVSSALADFEIEHISWSKKEKQNINGPHYRAAQTLKDHLGGI